MNDMSAGWQLGLYSEMRIANSPSTVRCSRCARLLTAASPSCSSCTRGTPPHRSANSTENQIWNIAQRLSLQQAVTILACIPIVLGPPIIALGLIGRQFFVNPEDFRLSDWQIAIIFAAANLIISVIILQHLGGEILIILKQIGFWLQGTEPSFTQPALTPA